MIKITQKITQTLKTYLSSPYGATLPAAAIIFPALLGMAGIGVDVTGWMMQKRNLQTAADVAALAGAYELYNGNEKNVEAAALKEAGNNGYIAADDSELTVTVMEVDGAQQVQVEIRQRANSFFAPLLMSGDAYTGTLAIAQIGDTDGNSDFCMLSLEPTANNAFVINGNVDIDAAGCSLAANSSGTPAFNVNGGAGDLVLSRVETVGTCNDCDLIQAESVTTGVSPFTDPYEDLELPEFEGCTQAEMNNGPLGVADLPAPDANGIVKVCGGFSLKNNKTATLPPGVYVVDGGDFKTGSGSNLTAEGVTIILTNSGSDAGYGSNGIMDTNGDINITAPLPGELSDTLSDYEGVAVYGDRNMAAGNKCHNARGQGTVSVNGTMYFPSNCLDYGGGSGMASGTGCSRVIASTITLHGNPDIANNCEGSGVRDITNDNTANIRLIY